MASFKTCVGIKSRPLALVDLAISKFILLQTSCDTYKYSFWPRTATDWNSLPSECLLIDSATKFKTTISLTTFIHFNFVLFYALPIYFCI